MDSKIDIHQHMNCIQMDLEFVCNVLKKDFIKMFVDSWDFYYDPIDGHFLTERLSQRNVESAKDRLRFLGIDEHILDIQFIDTMTLNQYLDNHKVLLLSIDSFFCPWHRGYEKTHIDHYCLVTGYDGSGYACYDPYLLGEERTHLSLSQIINGRELTYYTSSNSLGILGFKEVLWEIIKDEKQKNKMFKMMEAFAHDLSVINEPSELFDYPQDVYLCAITRTTKFIADGRIQLGYLLNNVDKPIGETEIISISSLLFQSGDFWHHLNSVFIKIFCVPRQLENAKKKMSEYMTGIIRVEKQILRDMKNYLKNI